MRVNASAHRSVAPVLSGEKKSKCRSNSVLSRTFHLSLIFFCSYLSFHESSLGSLKISFFFRFTTVFSALYPVYAWCALLFQHVLTSLKEKKNNGALFFFLVLFCSLRPYIYFSVSAFLTLFFFLSLVLTFLFFRYCCLLHCVFFERHLFFFFLTLCSPRLPTGANGQR